MRLHFKSCADLPIASAKCSCVVIDDVVYVGGCGESKVIYSYAENEWIGLPACPVMCFGLGKLFGRVPYSRRYCFKKSKSRCAYV